MLLMGILETLIKQNKKFQYQATRASILQKFLFHRRNGPRTPIYKHGRPFPGHLNKKVSPPPIRYRGQEFSRNLRPRVAGNVKHSLSEKKNSQK